MSTNVPPEVTSLAEARAEARRARDWAEADRLRAEIEAVGWKVVDHGVDYQLAPAHPPDVIEERRVRYGSSAAVPSRFGEAPTAEASVILLATDWPDDVERALDGLRRDAPVGTQTVIVADSPKRIQEAALEAHEQEAVNQEAVEQEAVEQEAHGAGVPGDGPPGTFVAFSPEIVWTSSRLGHGAALNAGVRRAAGRIVVLFDTSVEPVGDFIRPLVRALDDDSVAVAGAFGVVSADMRHFTDAPDGDVHAILGYCQAFRRADYIERGPLDEHFRFYRNLDLWWSLVLRDEGEGVEPRRAVALDLPLIRHEHRAWATQSEEERARLSKRNFYRLLDRFGTRTDLLRQSVAR